MGKEQIEQNLADIFQKLKGSQTQLIAVTKTRTAEEINWAIDCGVKHIGENRVQELLEKYDQIHKEDVCVHMIGRLQTNKVKYIIDKVDLIHSLDSFGLAEEISKRAVNIGKVQKVLIELNLGEEGTKGGITEKDLLPFLGSISNFKGITVCGLMCIPPVAAYPHQNLQYFLKMNQMSVDIKAKKLDNIHMDILSMGMTNDYEDAIAANSTYVRIGRGIFGPRNQPGGLI